MKNSLTQEPPTKVRPSEVDDKVCKGILDEINEASPEPEKVWRGGVNVRKGSPVATGTDECFTSEVAAWRARSRYLAVSLTEAYADSPFEQPLGVALALARGVGNPLILLDEEGREVKRWVIP